MSDFSFVVMIKAAKSHYTLMGGFAVLLSLCEHLGGADSIN